MTDIISITLENEMDLILAHKRAMRLGEKIGLTVATQTTFATAVSEVCRVVIEHTDKGLLHLGIKENQSKFSLCATIMFDTSPDLSFNKEGFFYAQKLVPEFESNTIDGKSIIQMAVGVPRSLRIDKLKVMGLVEFFKTEAPINAYEEIKNRNNLLYKVTSEQEQEIRQEKLINEKKSEFISIASHEIKTPITVLKAYTQMLRKLSDSCEPRVNEIVAKLDVQTTKLTMLVQQLMDVSQIENGSLIYKKEELDFNALVQDIIGVLRHVHNRHQMNLELTPPLKIFADRLRIEQVFTNLIGNAAKYSEAGSSITIHCEDQAGELIVSVKDQGLGMSDATLGSIFKKFYRDNEVLTSHSGLGMGLFIASKIVLDHGGKIWVESEYGEGSTFFISIPHL